MSDQNEMKANENQKDENQEQEVGILALEPCCDNGCILTDAANGCSVAEGNNTTASGFASHAEGNNTTASGFASHAEGNNTLASGSVSHAEGNNTTASGFASHAEGFNTIASGFASHAEGEETRAEGRASHAEGGPFRNEQGVVVGRTIAQGVFSHAEGQATISIGPASHAEGFNTQPSGFASHTEGSFTNAMGSNSHAEGSNTLASGDAAHAEGLSTTASFTTSHAEGFSTTSSGIASHAEGVFTIASAESSHAEGESTTASGVASHAEGRKTIANANFSHAEGNTTSTNGRAGAHIMGRFGNANDLNYSWYLANGTSPIATGLAAKILVNGNVKIDGSVSSPASDYAEMFETSDGQPIDVGYFVTFDGEKIRKANKKDEYILGITSATPAVLGSSGELRWKHKYITDEWGRVQYHDVVIPAEKDKDGNVIIPEYTEKQPMLNPDWDSMREYIPRLERPEWVAVGLLGQLLVRDDGTCQVNGYCRPNDEGIATAFDKGYRVMKRTGSNQILVLFNGNRIT